MSACSQRSSFYSKLEKGEALDIHNPINLISIVSATKGEKKARTTARDAGAKK